MNRTTISQSRQSHLCPFCSKQFLLPQTLQSHKPQCILGKSMRKPPLVKPLSASKKTQQQVLKDNVRFSSKDRFRIKKVGNGMSVTTGGWSIQQKSLILNNPNKMLSGKDQPPQELKGNMQQKPSQQESETVQNIRTKLNLSSKEDIQRQLRVFDKNSKGAYQVAEALANSQFEWPFHVQIHIHQLYQIQQLINEATAENNTYERLCNMRVHTLQRIKELLFTTVSTAPSFITERPKSKGGKVATNKVQNFVFGICPSCIGQLGFGEQVIQLKCQHRYHEDCWSKIESGPCIGCEG